MRTKHESSAAFIDVLSRVLPAGVKSHLKKRCVGVEHGTAWKERALLRFSDGTTHETDVVLGADGIKSTIRMKGGWTSFFSSISCLNPYRNALAFGEKANRLVDTGTDAYRGLIPTQRLLDVGMKEDMLRPWPRCWMSQDKVF